MTNETELKFSDNGQGDTESQEELDAALKFAQINLADISKPGALVTFGKEQLSLMQTILQAVTEDFREQIFWRMLNLVDEDEAMDHVAAFYEAKELGMDTSFNVAYSFALCSTHRKVAGTNLISMITDTLQHGKWAMPQKGSKNYGTNPRSPLSPG